MNAINAEFEMGHFEPILMCLVLDLVLKRQEDQLFFKHCYMSFVYSVERVISEWLVLHMIQYDPQAIQSYKVICRSHLNTKELAGLDTLLNMVLVVDITSVTSSGITQKYRFSCNLCMQSVLQYILVPLQHF